MNAVSNVRVNNLLKVKSETLRFLKKEISDNIFKETINKQNDT